MPWHRPSLVYSNVPHVCRTTFTVLLAIPLALLALAPGAGPAAAHPAAAQGQIGATSTPAVNLTLHYHAALAGITQPGRMGSDDQGNIYVSDTSADLVDVYDPDNSFDRTYGTGTVGTGNGSLNGPEGVAVYNSNVYVADLHNHQIQVFNKSTGAFVTEFGAANLSAPYGMALGINNQLYVVDNALNQVLRFSTAGVFLGSFGTAGTGNGQFTGPRGVAIGPTGTVYVTDTGSHRVEAFSKAGTYLTQWGSASFTTPDGIAADRSGMVYVVDTGKQTAYKFDPNGSLVGSYATPVTTPFVPGTFVTPADVVVSTSANSPIELYVSDTSTNTVQQFDQVLNPQQHTYQAQFGATGTSNGQFTGPASTVADSAGNVYVVDTGNNRVEKFDQFGNFVLAFGGLGSGNGQFSLPTGIAISPDSAHLYVADTGNNRIQSFDTKGTYQSQFGAAGTGNGQFNGPKAIASDGTHLYVTDSGNNRVEIFDASGIYHVQFGTAGNGNGQFSGPQGIAVDSNRQELFVADSSNNRVEVFTASGAFVTALASLGGGSLTAPVQVSADQRGDVYVADKGNNRIVEFDVNTTRSIAFGAAGSGSGQFSTPTGVAISPASGQIYVVDQGNNRIERWGSPWPKHDTVGVYRPSIKTFLLRNENTTGPADITVPMPYAQTGDLPIVGDWNGDGVDTVGLYRQSTGVFMLQDANIQENAPDYTFTLGNPGDTPIAGDWNGNGSDGAGIFRPSNGILYLKNGLFTGFADDSLVLGIPGDVGIAGDWNGDGQDSPGVYRPSNQTFFITNKVTNGIVYGDATAVLGVSGDAPFTGDWIAQGASGIGVFRPSNGITYEKNQITNGFADNNFIYGIAGDYPVAGQWVAPSVPFSAPAPHASLGTRSGSQPTAPERASTQPIATTPRRASTR